MESLIKCIIINDIGLDGCKVQLLQVEGLTPNDQLPEEFLNGYPHYTVEHDAYIQVSLGVNEFKIAGFASLHRPEHIAEFIEALRLAVQRERDIERAKIEWDGKIEVVTF